jgi:hypothetical protein
MKKKLSIAFLLLSFHLMAQKDTTNFNRSNSNEITYDFLNDHLINPANSCIKNKGIIKLNVKNVNRFLYNISIDGNATTFGSNQEVSSKALSKTDFSVANLNAFDIKTLKIHLNPLFQPSVDNEVRLTIMKQIQLQGKSNRNDTSINRKLDSLHNKIIEKTPNISQSKITRNDSIDISFNYSKILAYTDILNDDLFNLSYYDALYNEFFAILHQEGNTLEELIKEKNKVLGTFMDGTIDVDSLSGFIMEWKVDIQNDFTRLERTYAKYISIINKYKDTTISTEKINNIQKGFDDVIQAEKDFNNYDVNKLVIEIKKLNNYFTPSFFNFTTEIYVPDKSDALLTTLSIKPIENAGGLRNISKDFTFNITGGWKVDFSSGFFFNIGLADNSYFYDTTGINSPKDTAITFIRRNKDRNNFVPAIGFLVHAYKRKCEEVNWGYCFGLSTEEGKQLRYFLGISRFLGKQDRFILNLGLSGGSIKILSGRYEQDQTYAIKSLPTDVPTEDAFRVGAFLGLSYNISGTFKQNNADQLFKK